MFKDMNCCSEAISTIDCVFDINIPPDFGAELKIDIASFPSGSEPLLVSSSP